MLLNLLYHEQIKRSVHHAYPHSKCAVNIHQLLKRRNDFFAKNAQGLSARCLPSSKVC